MNRENVYSLLNDLKKDKITVNDAVLQLQKEPFENLGFAKIDTHRGLRNGIPEVIYGEGKTALQIIKICNAMIKNGQNQILITRLSSDKAELISEEYKLNYNDVGRIGLIGDSMRIECVGDILVVTGGTSDLPVAEETVFTAEAFGNKVKCLYDVGVAGLHRLLAHLDEIMSASVIIAIAGMEGALASVIAGLAGCPVIAVPTSIGYGASFGGVAALLSMINSCSSGISVVNIDNGFGAAYQASLINHLKRSN